MKKVLKWALGSLIAVLALVCWSRYVFADGTRGYNWSTPNGQAWGTPGACGSNYQFLQPSDSNCNLGLSNLMNFNAVTSVVTSTTPIMPLSSYMVLQTTGSGPVTITATPGISTSTVFGGTTPWPDGMYLILTSTVSGPTTSGAVVTLQDTSLVTNSQLNLTNGLGQGNASRVVLSSAPVELQFNATTKTWQILSR